MEHAELGNTFQDPLDEEERLLMDPESWEGNPVDGRSPESEIFVSPELGIRLEDPTNAPGICAAVSACAQ